MLPFLCVCVCVVEFFPAKMVCGSAEVCTELRKNVQETVFCNTPFSLVTITHTKYYWINSKTISVRCFLHTNDQIEFPKQFSKGFGNPLLTLLTKTQQFQKQIGSVITEQELPRKKIESSKDRFGDHVLCNGIPPLREEKARFYNPLTRSYNKDELLEIYTPCFCYYVINSEKLLHCNCNVIMILIN